MCRSYGRGKHQRQQRYKPDLDLNASGFFLAYAENNHFNQQWKINSSNFGHFY
jgi:hypothetical protein